MMPATASADPAIRDEFDPALPGGTARAGWPENDLNLSDRSGISLFGRRLRELGYPGPSGNVALGRELGSLHRRRDLPLFLRRLEGPDALKTLAKLFAFQTKVSEAEARAAFAPLGLERCAKMGLVRVNEGEAASVISIASCDQILIAHDPANIESRKEADAAHVLGISPPTLVLAKLILRQPARRALDIGTGSGLQALSAAAHCDRVIGTDLNPRALIFAEFNAILNDVKNVEFRQGSLFEPVAGEKFDLIISNPPYVISPESTFLYRDGGKTADGFCENLVRTLPAHLNEGGFACMLANWAHYTEEHWSAPVQRWVAGGGCDGWALHGQEHDPLSYAADWNRHRERSLYAKALDEWLAYYQRLGIRSISSGGIVLRRRSAERNWFRADELGGEMHPLSDSILRVFATEDFLAGKTDEDLLDHRFVLKPSHRIVQQLVPGQSDYEIESMRLEVTHHPPYSATLEPNTVHFLRECTGQRTLREILGEVAQRVGGDPRICLERGLGIARGLLAHGVLAPCPV